jgi:aspartyl-tRNA(Asn)/glutamyl-tRNA(Gln) amidotransferase subunit C
MRTTLHKAACIIVCARALPRITPPRPSRKLPVSLDKDQVQHIAMLAKIKLDDDDFAETVQKLSRIVDFVDQLSQAETDNVVPMAHPYNETQRLRPDTVTEVNDREHIQQNTELADGGMYLVPKVLD